MSTEYESVTESYERIPDFLAYYDEQLGVVIVNSASIPPYGVALFSIYRKVMFPQ
jgi:hypothetical protein